MVNKKGVKVGVVNLQGKVFMQPIPCPFASIDELAPKLKKECDVLIVDFHAEATSEKQAMGWNLAGIATAIIWNTYTYTNI